MLEYGANPNEQLQIRYIRTPALIVFIRIMRMDSRTLPEVFTTLLEYGAELEPNWVEGTTVLEEVEKKEPLAKAFLLEKIAEHRMSTLKRSVGPEEAHIVERQKG